MNRRTFLSGVAATIASPRHANAASSSTAQRSSALTFVAPEQKLRCIAACNPFNFASIDHIHPDRFAPEPYVAGWKSWSEAMPSSLLSSLKTAGFDGLRLVIDPGPLFTAANNTMLRHLFLQITAAVDNIVDYGLKCIVDMHVGLSSSSVALGWSSVDVIIGGINSPKLLRLATVEQALGDVLDRRYRATDVAFELFNEPPSATDFSKTDPWTRQLKHLFDAVRTSAPRLTLIVAGVNPGFIDGLISLDPTQFDENTIFSFHNYFPDVFTNQSIPGVYYQDIAYISRLPFPPSAGNKMTAINAAQAAINADDKLTTRTKAVYTKQVDKRLGQYFDTPHDGAWIGTTFAPVVNWADHHKIARNRIILGEFGAWGDFNGRLGADLTSRASYLEAARQQAEAVGFNWSVWELEDATGWKITSGSQVLIPQLVKALGLNAV